MKIYDVFEEKYITEDEISQNAPPERYIFIDDNIITNNTSTYEINSKI